MSLNDDPTQPAQSLVRDESGTTSALGRRTFLRSAGAGVAVAGLAGCLEGGDGGATDGEDGDGGELPAEIRVGVLAPEPENNPIGASIANGASLAAQQIEADDEILPDADSIDVSVENTEENPQAGREAYQTLTVEEESHVTTGVFTSEVLLQLLDSIADQETVHLTTGAASPRASKRVNENYDRFKYHFRTGPINGYHLGVNMFDFLDAKASDLGWDSIALLVEDYEWTNPVEDGIDDHIDDVDIDITMRRRYASGTENFGPIYDEVESAGADAVYVAMAHTGTPALVQWVQDRRPFEFGGIHVLSQLPAYYELTDGACRYVVSQNTATPQSELTDKTVPFAEAYNDEFDGYPVYTGYITYDAVMQWATTVTDGGSVDSDAVVEGLENSDYVGTAGPLNYYGQDHEFAHDVVYDPAFEDGVNPVYQQWQEQDGEGVQAVLHPDYVASAEYERPPWL